MHSRIRMETVKLWRPSKEPLQFLKSHVYWKSAHTWALFVFCCHYRLCGSTATQTAKLAANIINRHAKLWAEIQVSSKHHYISHNLPFGRCRRNSENLSLCIALALSLIEILPLTGIRLWKQSWLQWFHTTNKALGKCKVLGSHWDTQPLYLHSYGIFASYETNTVSKGFKNRRFLSCVR